MERAKGKVVVMTNRRVNGKAWGGGTVRGIGGRRTRRRRRERVIRKRG